MLSRTISSDTAPRRRPYLAVPPIINGKIRAWYKKRLRKMFKSARSCYRRKRSNLPAVFLHFHPSRKHGRIEVAPTHRQEERAAPPYCAGAQHARVGTTIGGDRLQSAAPHSSTAARRRCAA